MKRPKPVTRVLLAIALLVTAVVFQPVSSAQAAASLDGWPVALPRDGQVVSNPAGGVLAIPRASNDTVGSPDVQQVKADGSLGWATDHVAGRTILPLPVFDGFSNAYWGEQVGQSTAIVSVSPAGVPIWRTPMPAGWYTQQMVVGVNGDLYALGASCCPLSLKRLSPVDGHVIFTIPLPGTLNGRTKIFAYTGGLIVADTAVTYLDHDGVVVHQYPLPVGSNTPRFAASADGTLFAANVPADSNGCTFGAGSLSITRYTPDAGQQWNYLAPVGRCNVGPPQLAALPSGGVVGTFAPDGTVGRVLTALATDKTVAWSRVPLLSLPEFPPGAIDVQALHVDIAGHIVAVEDFGYQCQNKTQLCSGVQVEFLAESDGSPIRGTEVIYQPDPNPGEYFGVTSTDTSAIETGRVYLSLTHFDGSTVPISGIKDYPLIALDAPSLVKAYPVANLLDLMPSGTTPTPPPPPDGNQHGIVKAVRWAVGPTTPLWNLDVSVDAALVICPATLVMTIGTWEKRQEMCGIGASNPTSYRFNWKVFSASKRLSPGQNASIVAYIAKSDGPRYGGPTTTLAVPPAPAWIGAGDSYSSGHHQDRDNITCVPNQPFNCAPDSLIANDNAFSWVTLAADQLNRDVPAEWRYSVAIVAQSGVSTGQMLEQGQLDRALAGFSAHAGAWNILSITGGADNVPFNKTLEKFYSDHILGKPKPWDVKTWKDCPDVNALYAAVLSEKSNITSDLIRALDMIRTQAPSARIVDVTYPYVLKSDNVCAINRVVPIDPSDLTQTAVWHGTTDVIDALDSTHAVVAGTDILKVDLRSVFGTNPLPELQLTRYFGYPHADASGQRKTAAQAVKMLKQ